MDSQNNSKYICFSEKVFEKYGKIEASIKDSHDPLKYTIYELINCLERWVLSGFSHAKIEYKDSNSQLITKHNYADIAIGYIPDDFYEIIFDKSIGKKYNIPKEYFVERYQARKLLKVEMRKKKKILTFDEKEKLFREKYGGNKYNIPEKYYTEKKEFMIKMKDKLKQKGSLDPEDYECIISQKDLKCSDDILKVRLEEFTEANIRREMNKFSLKLAIELYEKGCEKYKDEILELYRTYPILKSEEGLREIEEFYKGSASSNPGTETKKLYMDAHLLPERMPLHVKGTEQKLARNYGEMQKDLVTYKYSGLIVGGQFWSVKHPLYDQWIKDLDLINEGFTGPFNRKLTGTYCSLFRSDPGSCGRFQDAEEVRKGNWMVNPPFTESICEMAADVCINKMTGNYAFVAPTWYDATYYIMLSKLSEPVQAIGINYVKPDGEEFRADSVQLTIWKYERSEEHSAKKKQELDEFAKAIEKLANKVQ